LAWFPEESTLTIVNVSLVRSYRKTSGAPFVSDATRSVASESNATNRPFGDITGFHPGSDVLGSLPSFSHRGVCVWAPAGAAAVSPPTSTAIALAASTRRPNMRFPSVVAGVEPAPHPRADRS
jgi:hypothetical protein